MLVQGLKIWKRFGNHKPFWKVWKKSLECRANVCKTFDFQGKKPKRLSRDMETVQSQCVDCHLHLFFKIRKKILSLCRILSETITDLILSLENWAKDLEKVWKKTRIWLSNVRTLHKLLCIIYYVITMTKRARKI